MARERNPMPEVMTAAQFNELQRGVKPQGRFPVSPKPERTVDGILFASKGEARRYSTLKLSERAGLIKDLKLQPRFAFAHNNVDLGHYTADFQYVLVLTGETVVEDVKSSGTAKERDYILRTKMVKAFHGTTIKEVLVR